MEEPGCLRERVLDLQRHFGQANADIEKIVTSSERINSRGRASRRCSFEEQAPAAEIASLNGAAAPPPPLPSPQREMGEPRPRCTRAATERRGRA